MSAQQMCDGAKNILKLIVLFLWYGGADAWTVRNGQSSDTELLYNVLAAMKTGVQFFGHDYSAVNLDALFGIRICQGTVIQSMKYCSRTDIQCPQDVKAELKETIEDLDNIAEGAMPYVEQQDPAYYRQFLQTIDAPYMVQYIPEQLGDSREMPVIDVKYDETTGDKCLVEITDVSPQGNRMTPKCTISDFCWNFMTRNNTGSYVITHQLLYFILGEKAGCKDKLEERFSTYSSNVSLRAVQKQLCQKIYSEAKQESTGGKVEILTQDLFLEQIMVCGILGFQEFFAEKWITMVLSWQSSNGCFTMADQLVKIEEALLDTLAEQRKLMDLLRDEAIHIEAAQPVWTGRKLMREKIMTGDCLAHKTGLGMATLGVFLRHLIQEVYGPQAN